MFNYPFEYAFLHTKPRAVARNEKPQRYDGPLGSYAVVPTGQQTRGSSVISMEGGKYMERKPVSIAAKKRDSTIYIVEYTISDNAKESAYEKVKRLILKDTKSYLEKSA